MFGLNRESYESWKENDPEDEFDENDGDEEKDEFRRDDGRKTGVDSPAASVSAFGSIRARLLYADDSVDAIAYVPRGTSLRVPNYFFGPLYMAVFLFFFNLFLKSLSIFIGREKKKKEQKGVMKKKYIF